MSKRWLLLLMVLIFPALACNLSDDGDVPVPTNAPQVVVVTSTPSRTPVSNPITQNTSTPTSTPSSSNSGSGSGSNSGNSGSGNTGNVVTGPPVLSNMSFSSSPGGANVPVFQKGEDEVYLRFNYSNVSIGTTMERSWYRDGQLITTREENWSSNWGNTGRLTHIKLFDYDDGLTSGNYTVYVTLPEYGVQISGNFKINASAPAFDKLTFSRSSDGQSATVFPYGTEEVYARWNFSGVPAGAVMVREWYRDGQLIIDREETWRSEWGTDGTISHVRLYDFDSGYGLEPGNYRVVIYLRDIFSARVEANFTIEDNVGPAFSNLRFAPGPDSQATTSFAAGTQEVYAIWDYSYIPNAAQVRRIWKRNGTVIIDRQEAWDFTKYGTSGTVKDIKIFDYEDGLSSGTYEVFIQIVGQSVQVTGSFTIAATQVNPTLGTLTVSTQAGGQAASSFPFGTDVLYAAFDFQNVASGTQVQIKLQSTDAGAVNQTQTITWPYVQTGRVTDLQVVKNVLQIGSYQLTITLPAYGVSVSTTFNITPQ